MRPRLLVALVVLLAASGCTSKSSSKQSSLATSTTRPPAGPQLRTLPSGCRESTPAPTATVTFVRDGRAWAFDPDTATVSCLFTVADAGLFEWGPRGDRVVLDGLSVRGVGSKAARTAQAVKPVWFSWSRPQGVALVFTTGARTKLQRADIGGGNAFGDVTPPVPGAKFGDIAYHPSGFAFAFVAEQGKTTGVWISGNQGENPKALVTSTDGTQFGPIVFTHDGQHLVYGAHKSDGSYSVDFFDLTNGNADLIWSGAGPVAAITEGRNLDQIAVTAGPCGARTSAITGTPGVADVASGLTNVSTIGSVGGGRFLVAQGACDGQRDLYLAEPGGPEPKLLVRGVERVATRLPDPSPPPALPAALPRSGFA